ncbi:MAG TPA: hypothetical protein VK110_06200 [Salinisphaeraceae bacterium]|nr:hypothetical protein [Salinisphaeraceae bacterium]
MPKITVKKLVAGELEKSFRVPASALKIGVRFLPASALGDLAQRGIDLKSILAALRRGEQYSSSLQVAENGVQKTIVISVA